MTTIDVTAIVMALIGMLSGWFNWWLDRRRHKAEVKNLEAQVEGLKMDNERKYMELVTDMVTKFRELIVKPLEAEVEGLRKEVKDLKDAIEGVYDCPYRAECPVRDKLAKKRPTR